MNLIDELRVNHRQFEIASGYRKGYWLVRSSDQSRHYIAPVVNPYALEKVADRVLNEKSGWDYWIDYCHGLDVNGSPAWSNIDLTDLFI